MRQALRITARFVAGLVLASAVFSAHGDELLDRAKALLGRKDAKAAYGLLLPQEERRAGDPDFDYLLGIAALDAGDPERAVFALERVLALQPNNHVARAEIARAFLAMGERDSAKREFEAVRGQNIPDEARATIERFLSAISAAEVTQVTGFLEAGIGTDSNVNSATASGQVAIPVLGGIIATLNAGATKRSDTFTNLSGGVGVTHKLSQEWAIVGSAGASLKLNSSETQFDTRTIDANLGARWARNQEAITVGAQYQDFELDNARYRETAGAVAQWQHSFDERRQATVFAQFSQLRYPTQSIRNADRQIVGIAYAHAFTGDYSPVLFASAYAGQENELASGVPHLGHDPVGFRLGGQVRLATGLSAFANASYEGRRYGGPDPIFQVNRNDRQTDFGGGLSYVLRPGMTVIGRLAQTDNRSNIDLDRFKRTVATVSIRMNF